jgi:signal transduction histidine kinase
VLLFATAAWEMRRVAYDQQMREARSDAQQQATLLLSSTTATSWPTGDQWGKYPYELVASGGLLSSSSQLKAFEAGGKAFMPLPPTAAQLPYAGSFAAVFPSGAASPLAGTAVTAVSAAVPVSDLHASASASVAMPGGGAKDRTVRAYVFVTTGPADAAVAALDRVLYPAVPVAVSLVALVAYLAVRRALRPVEQIRARTAAVTATDPHERVAVPRTGDEVARLAGTINATLERLEAASRIQRRFVADAAHELRSPLASLLATLEVAQAYPERADWPETVAVAALQARRLQALSDDLLLLARLDAAPDASVAASPLDLTELACEVAADFAARRIEVTVLDGADGAVVVNGQSVRLERMLRNLVDNAVRHARTRVDISVSADDRDGVLTVEDDGPGIPPAERERVFDRFTRLDADRSRDTGGAGLGLAIAREIAERHGGTLQVADSDGGARLSARIPLAR